MRHRILRSALVIVFPTCFVLASASTGRADDGKTDEVVILPLWKAGDKQRYERVKTRRRTSGGKETERGSARGTIDVSIIEAGEKGFLMRWRIGKTTPDDPKVAANPLSQAMNRLVEGLTLDIELDDGATITGLRNWAELKEAGAKIGETVIEGLRAAGADAKILAGIQSTGEALFASKERVEQSFIKDPLVFLLPLGRAYPGVGKPMDYEDLLPNPLGGPPFPCKGRITLTSYEPAKHRAVVTWTQTLDPKETDRIVRETLKSAFPHVGPTQPKDEEVDPGVFEDRAEIVIDTKTGWVERYTHTRSSTGKDGSAREEILTMTQQPTPR